MGQRVKVGLPAELDAQALLQVIMPATKEGLEEQERFAPLAAVVGLNGKVRRISDPDAEVRSVESTQTAVAWLREALQVEAKSGTVRSAALAADVRIWRRQDGDEASNAVSVHVEHQDGYCVDLLIPYKVRRGMMSRLRKKPQVMFRSMIAQESDAVIFNQPVRASTGGRG